MAGAPQDHKPKPPQGVTLSCTSCGAPLPTRAIGYTVEIACPSCGTLLDATTPGLKILKEYKGKLKHTPRIPLGSRGTLAEIEWEVIGYSVRRDQASSYTWEEYLLFNPYFGFRFLGLADGHWNLMEVLTEPAVENAVRTMAKFDGEEYKLYHRGNASTQFVLGEFYWRVQMGSTVGVADFIAPPYSLSYESDGTEVTWTRGLYVPPDAVKQAFKAAEGLPAPQGVAPNQPSVHATRFKAVKRLSWLFTLILFGVQIYYASNALEQEVLKQRVTIAPKDTVTTVELTSPSFELTGGSKNVEVALEASSLSNNWVATSLNLVNEGTGESYDIEQGVEYYSGTDSDGSWSEGSRSTDMLLTSIPEGKYHIEGEVAMPKDLPQQDIVLTLKRDVAIWSNFWIILTILWVTPLFFWWRHYSFEYNRWSNSDYSPYASSDDDDSSDDSSSDD